MSRAAESVLQLCPPEEGVVNSDRRPGTRAQCSARTWQPYDPRKTPLFQQSRIERRESSAIGVRTPRPEGSYRKAVSFNRSDRAGRPLVTSYAVVRGGPRYGA